MPNIRQQKKRVRIAARERVENLRYRSGVKTLTKRLENAVVDGDAETIAAEQLQLMRMIDKRRAAQEHGRAEEGAGGADRRRLRHLAAGS